VFAAVARSSPCTRRPRNLHLWLRLSIAPPRVVIASRSARGCGRTARGPRVCPPALCAPKSLYLVAVLLHVNLRGLIRVVGGMEVMPPGSMCMMSRLRVIALPRSARRLVDSGRRHAHGVRAPSGVPRIGTVTHRARARHTRSRARTEGASKPRVSQIATNENGQAVSSDMNHASTSAKRRCSHHVGVPAYNAYSANASDRTALISRFSGRKAASCGRTKNCTGRIVGSRSINSLRHLAPRCVAQLVAM
jgi:hypothetical protein